MQQDDLDLREISVTVNGGLPGIVTHDIHESGYVRIALWTDRKKTQPFISHTVPANILGMYTFKVYAEGLSESSNTTDISSITFKFRFTNLLLTLATDQLDLLVYPFVETATAKTPGHYSKPSVLFNNNLNGLEGLRAQYREKDMLTNDWIVKYPGIQFEADVFSRGKPGEDPDALEVFYVQLLTRIDNGINNGGIGIDYLPNFVDLKLTNNSDFASFPMLDAKPTSQIFLNGTNVGRIDSMRTNIKANDSPSLADYVLPSFVDKIDVSYHFTTYLVTKLFGGSFYTLYSMDWYVQFSANTNVANQGVTVIPNTSKSEVLRDWERDNSDIAILVGQGPNKDKDIPSSLQYKTV